MWTLFRHFKGGEYLGMGTALHSETLEQQAIYLTLYENPKGALWTRPLAMFNDSATSDGERRFAPVARMRRLALEDTLVHFSFGKDAWGAGLTLEEHVRQYDGDKNFLRGNRYLLETCDGTPVAVLNLLRFLPEFFGIASLATRPDVRGQGYASLLLRAVMALVRWECEGAGFGLFSEIDSAYYARLGFVPLPQDVQLFLPSIAMTRSHRALTTQESALFTTYF